MGIARETDAATEPLTAEEVATQVRLDYSLYTGAEKTTLDAELDALIMAARIRTEEEVGRAWITQTWIKEIPCFEGRIRLERPPLQSVTSITYYDADGNQQTLGTSVYGVDTKTQPALIYLKDGQSWPATATRHDAVTITYVAGYGDDAADVPSPARHAMKMLIAHLWENREAAGQAALKEIPMSVQWLLAPYYTIKVG